MSQRSLFSPMRGRGQEAEEEVLTVSELDARLQRSVQGLGRLVVEGEVAAYRGASPGGHLYFTLKDERADASISCVMWRSDAARAGGEQVQPGARVRVRASADVYTPRGQLQLQVLRVTPSGDGALLVKREALLRKLAAEGLFAAERKRPLPADARVIGVVTSGSGAVLHDIVTVAQRRGAVRILVAPCAVQGEDAPRQLRRALERLSRVHEVDVIVIGRGGGSAEDLAAFDDEALARAIVACPKPVVAAVGHETDTSIACLAADRRAATPSQAAELVVPDDTARRARLDEAARRLTLAVRARLSEDRAVLEKNWRKLRAPERALSLKRQQLDELRSRLSVSTRDRLSALRRRREDLARRLAERHPRAVLSLSRAALLPTEARLRAAMQRTLQQARAALSERSSQLSAYSPLSVLARGYAIVLAPGASGRARAVREATEVAEGDALEIRLHRGALDVRVTGTRPKPERP